MALIHGGVLADQAHRLPSAIPCLGDAPLGLGQDEYEPETVFTGFYAEGSHGREKNDNDKVPGGFVVTVCESEREAWAYSSYRQKTPDYVKQLTVCEAKAHAVRLGAVGVELVALVDGEWDTVKEWPV